MNVSVDLRPARGKLFCLAEFETEFGPLTIDHIYVRPGDHGRRPRVELPQRPDGGLWLPVVRLPDPMFAALVDAIARALAS